MTYFVPKSVTPVNERAVRIGPGGTGVTRDMHGGARALMENIPPPPHPITS